MSGTSVSGPNYGPPVADPLTDSERVDVRRFSGYPAYGSGSNTDFAYRFSRVYIELEYHMRALTDSELVICRAKLAELNGLDQAVPGSGANLDTESAAVWHWNKNEIQDRTRLFNLRRRALCDFLGVPPGPALRSGGNTVSFIV